MLQYRYKIVVNEGFFLRMLSVIDFELKRHACVGD